jgi:hypothetical protein
MMIVKSLIRFFIESYRATAKVIADLVRDSRNGWIGRNKIGESELARAFDAFTRATNKLTEATKESAVALWKPIREAYEAAGEPYGPTDEGMRRWWEEQQG